LGRLDHQVKVRGFRIELGEIETALGRHPGVREGVVVAREDVPGDKRLVAYVVPDGGQPPSISVLRQHLKERLPEYMVPTAFVILGKFPLTPNGKIDRRSLPSPTSLRPELESAYVAPRSQIERTITSIWQAVLHLEKIGIHDNFFDLGGHSLRMAQVHSKLRQKLQSDLSILEMFKYPTISSLAQFLSQGKNEQISSQKNDERVEKLQEGKIRLKQRLRQREKADN
jgi:acyl carrier protein